MIQKILAVVFGSLMIGIGINYFVIPHHLLDGGIIGLGLLGKYAFDLQPGLTIIILSIPLYLIAFFYNRNYFYNGVHGLLVSSFFIDLFRPLSYFSVFPIFLSSLSGGIVIGIGISIMLINNISAGGSDLLALILSKITSINVGIFILSFDSIVILTGALVIPEATVLYSAILVGAVGLTAFVVTGILKPIMKE
ncbi:YitT family protein [Ornithinibacillus scapharcae]|uniref:YitT family protein n=1 Tax=Ornithinibacillus scapharcae TaxID=1147159 RepID=UPI000225BC21|nr:YitT family protein [Ornithinibacillus scapharcae]